MLWLVGWGRDAKEGWHLRPAKRRGTARARLESRRLERSACVTNSFELATWAWDLHQLICTDTTFVGPQISIRQATREKLLTRSLRRSDPSPSYYCTLLPYCSYCTSATANYKTLLTWPRALGQDFAKFFSIFGWGSISQCRDLAHAHALRAAPPTLTTRRNFSRNLGVGVSTRAIKMNVGETFAKFGGGSG